MHVCLAALLGIIFVVAPANTYGQVHDVIRIPSDRTLSCEYSKVVIGSLPFRSEDEVLIVSYRGSIDTVRRIEKKRLRDAESYLGSYNLDTIGEVWRLNVTGALANKKLKEGQLDFYVNGVLRLSMKFTKNREARLGSCT